jgi:hypothetical protein
MIAPSNNSGLRIVALLCVAEVLGMTGFSTYPALLAPLREAWGMSGTAARLWRSIRFSASAPASSGRWPYWLTQRKGIT